MIIGGNHTPIEWLSQRRTSISLPPPIDTIPAIVVVGRTTDNQFGIIYVLSYPDGLTLTVVAGGPVPINDVAFGNNMFIAVGNSGDIYRNIGDPLLFSDWTYDTTFTNENLMSVVFTEQLQFVIVGQNGIVMKSSDGLAWAITTESTATLNRYVEGTTEFTTPDLIVGEGGEIVGSTLTAPNNLKAGAFGNNTYVLMGTAGANVYGTTPENLVFDTALPAVQYNDILYSKSYSTFYIAGEQGRTEFSSSGAPVWNHMQTITFSNLHSLAEHGVNLYVCGDDGTINRSTDRVNWTDIPNTSTEHLTGISAGVKQYGPEPLPVLDSSLKLHLSTNYFGKTEAELFTLSGSDILTWHAITGSDANIAVPTVTLIRNSFGTTSGVSVVGNGYLNGDTSISNLGENQTIFLVSKILDFGPGIDSFFGYNIAFSMHNSTTMHYHFVGSTSGDIGFIPVNAPTVMSFRLGTAGTGNLEYFVNGVYVSATSTGALFPDTNQVYQIGANVEGAQSSMVAYDLLVYNRKFSDSEMTATNQNLLTKIIIPGL